MSVLLERIFLQILEMSIIAGYCVAAVLVLRWLFRRAPKKYSYLLWIIVAFRLVCPLSVGSAVSIFNLNILPQFIVAEVDADSGESDITQGADDQPGGVSGPGNQPGEVSGADGQPGQIPGADGAQSSNPEQVPGADGVQSGDSEQVPGADGVQSGDPEQLPGADGVLNSQPGQIPGAAGANQLRWQTVSAWIWLLGVIILSSITFVSWGRLKLRLRRAVRVSDGVYETDEIDSAFVMGIIKPGIYLPVGLNQQEQEWVLLHERCHIARRDHLVKVLAALLTILHWFNPLVWAAWVGMCRDMEMSCDEKALEGASGEMRKAYSRTLLAVAANKKQNWSAITAFGEVSVKSRIKHVLNVRKPAVWMGVIFAVMMITVLVVFGTNGQGKAGAPADGETFAEGDEHETGESKESDEENSTGGVADTEEADTEGDTGESAGENTEESTSAGAVGRDAWKEVIWEVFLNYDEANPYSGEHGEFHDEASDLDGDGILDRIFRYQIHEYYSIEYLFLSGGEIIELSETVGESHKAISVDIEGDGAAEIAITEVTWSTGHDVASLRLLKKTEDGWQAMPRVSANGREYCGFETLVIPVTLKKTDDTHMLVTQPDCGITVEKNVFVDQFDHWGFDKGDYGPINSSVYSSAIWLGADPETGRTVLKAIGNVGDKWVSKFVIWEMVYEDGAWRIIDFVGTDSSYYGEWYIY